MKNALTMILIMIIFVATSATMADVPQTINYQGRLTDTGGEPLPDTTLNITFSIYRFSGELEWTSGPQAVQVTNGVFDYALGSNVPLGNNIVSRTYSCHLGIKIGDDDEIVPRTELVSAPYAYNASRSDTAYFALDISDGIVTGSKISSYAITSTKISGSAVISGHIQDGTIQFQDIGSNSAVDGEIMKMVGGVWTASTDETGAGGDISAVYAGDGLIGGGTSGDVTILVDTGGITSTHLATSSVYSAEIADNTITAVDIATDGVGASEISAGAVGASEIATGAVGSSEIATNAVYSAEIADNTITAVDIAPNAVGSSEIAAGAVYSSEIADNTITAADIATDGVGASEISAGAVGASEIATGAVGSSEIATSAVYSAEIADGTIMNADISSSAAISTSKIYGTAVNQTSTQTITGSKTFDGYVYFCDSTMRVSPSGVRIGDPTSPSSSFLLRLSRSYNTTSTRYGLYVYLTNSSANSGIIYGASLSAYNLSTNTSNRYGLNAVAGTALNISGYSYGVRGVGEGGIYAYGVYGRGRYADHNYGGYFTTSKDSPGYAGYFSGDVGSSGFLSTAGSGMKIDHPLDPTNKYLFHNSVQSPEMKTIYDGNITTDNNGYAKVYLPEYFEALNSDFRYQLTVIGDFGQAIIANEVFNNSFSIRTENPDVKVSWQVTGIRKDAYADSKRTSVEVEKLGQEVGLYQNPGAYGLSETESVNYIHEKNEDEELNQSNEASEFEN